VYYCIRSEINLLVAIFCCDRVILTTGSQQNLLHRWEPVI